MFHNGGQTIRGVWHVARIAKMRNKYKSLVEISEEKRELGGSKRSEMMLLERIFRVRSEDKG
jgi:hypothetical protein